MKQISIHFLRLPGCKIGRREFRKYGVDVCSKLVLKYKRVIPVYDILKYIHDNIKTPLLAGNVAREFGYSKWYFCDRFKSFTGRTFVEYVRHYRIALAAAEVLSGGRISDIALSYGYDSIGGFNKAFLKEYGCSPTEYLKQVKDSQLYYEKRRISMFQLSDRCAALREEAVNQKNYMKAFHAQREVYFTVGMESAKEAGEKNLAGVSCGLVYTLEHFSPVIIPGELIVGLNYGYGNYREWYTPDDNAEGWQAMGDNGISDTDARRYFDYKKKRLESPKASDAINLTEAEQQSEQEWAAIGRCMGSAHTVIGYEAVLKKGFSGLLKEVEEAEAKNGACPLYEAAKRICRSAVSIGDKYAQKARELLESDSEEYRKEDLEQIIANCARVPRYPAGSFVEAVQAIWFAHILNTWEDGITANSVGRLDQILYPYYKADIEKGVLNKEQAFEILCCLWIKLYRDYDVQQSCVGGTNPDGSSAVNELSYMMLDVTEQLNFIRCLSVRYSLKTDKAFVRRALEVVGHLQKGVPFFFNDDIMIPALEAKGISHVDACDYTQLGCVETVIPGKSNPHAVTGEVNLLKAIEYTLCNGRSMVYPEFCPGIETGETASFHTYQQFYEAVLKQIENMLDLSCSKIAKYRIGAIEGMPRPYKSLLTEDCIEKGRDFNDAGAKYDYYQVMLCAIPNLADSLAVIKKFVYDDKKYTIDELKQMLQDDFPDEAVRLEFVNKAPKYGNDIDEVDSIAADIMDKACDMLDVLSEKYGLSFHAQPFTYLWLIDHGNHSAASPDGRRKGEPIAYSCSSMQGRDFNGLTALLNSIAKLPAKKAPGTTSTIVEVDPKLFCDRNLNAMTDIFLAASKKGLCNVQFNIVDADTLIDAQKYPEHYNNLAVRVSGFSQKFNLLSPELQNHIIGRTKHVCF